MKRLEAADLLCTAIEGGSNYWALFSNRKEWAVTVSPSYDPDDFEPKTIELDDIVAAAPRAAHLYPHLANAIADPTMHDVEIADVVLQVAMFQKIVFG